MKVMDHTGSLEEKELVFNLTQGNHEAKLAVKIKIKNL